MSVWSVRLVPFAGGPGASGGIATGNASFALGVSHLPAIRAGGCIGIAPLSGDSLGPRHQTLAVELRIRRESDLDACEQLAHVVHAVDGYPRRCADDLRVFVSAADALGGWVAQLEKGIVGHGALQPRGSRAAMALGSAATGRPPEQLCVVARLFVSPTERKAGISGSLLALAADAGLARGLWPILDVAAHLDDAVRLYEGAGWMCAGQVTVDLRNEAPLEELVYIGPASGSLGH